MIIIRLLVTQQGARLDQRVAVLCFSGLSRVIARRGSENISGNIYQDAAELALRDAEREDAVGIHQFLIGEGKTETCLGHPAVLLGYELTLGEATRNHLGGQGATVLT